MTVEAATYIEDLNVALPAVGDPKSEGDDHLRLIKAVLKAGHFPFPATQAPSSDPNTLDDYERGSFTPTILFGGAAVGMTFSTRVGRYTKIGNRTLFSIEVLLSAKGSSVGSALFGGLPFSAANYGSCAMAAWSMTGTVGHYQAFISPGTTNLNPYYTNTGTPSSFSDANFTNTSEIALSGHYET